MVVCKSLTVMVHSMFLIYRVLSNSSAARYTIARQQSAGIGLPSVNSRKPTDIFIKVLCNHGNCFHFPLYTERHGLPLKVNQCAFLTSFTSIILTSEYTKCIIPGMLSCKIPPLLCGLRGKSTSTPS